MKITQPRRDEQLIGLLVPTAPSYPRPQSAPLPTLPVLPQPDGISPADLLLGTARPDRSGRVTERSLLAALNWRPGHRVDIDLHGGALVIGTAATGCQRLLNTCLASLLPLGLARNARMAPTGRAWLPRVVIVHLMLLWPAILRRCSARSPRLPCRGVTAAAAGTPGST